MSRTYPLQSTRRPSIVAPVSSAEIVESASTKKREAKCLAVKRLFLAEGSLASGNFEALLRYLGVIENHRLPDVADKLL
jgi:hypothetical protein